MLAGELARLVAELTVSRRARQDLEEIWSYIAGDSVAAADRTVLAIWRKFEALREQPRMGSPRPEVRQGMRLLVEEPFLILYEFRASTDVVEIVRVVHGARNLSALF